MNRRELINSIKDINPLLYNELRYGYPNLEKCLIIISRGRYKSHGFPMFFLDYNYMFKYWGVAFRNPVAFSNPEIKESTPTKACHAMLDFLLTRIKDKGAL